MNPEIDDPILTAYALGELNEQECAVVEARLQTDAEARQFVEETRVFSGELGTLLKAAPATDLTPEQKAEVLLKIDGFKTGGRKVIAFPRWIAPLGLAASVATAFVLSLQEVKKPAGASPRMDATENEVATVMIAPAKVDAAPASVTLAVEGKLLAKNEEEKALGNMKSAKELQPSKKQMDAVVGKDGLKQSANAATASGPIQAAAPQLASSDQQLAQAPASAPLVAGYASSMSAMNGQTQAMITYSETATRALDKDSRASFGMAVHEQPASDSDATALPGLPQREPGNTEAYDRITDNEFLAVHDQPLSTFSIDVDTASYANMRRFLDGGSLPPKDAVRIEELLNYFEYDYPQPKGDDPFSVNVEVAPAPWNPKHLLAKIGLKGREIAPEKRPPMNLVFLLDVSGSMDEPNKLPLVRQSMKMLVGRLKAEDRVAIVVYAGASGMALPSTPASHKKEIEAAIDSLTPGGSTNGAAGIQLAYDIAKANFIKDGVNRVIQCTDGDFNVGVTNQGDLLRMVEEKAKSGVFLTELGFGMGNYKDSTLEKLADKGNGNYGYVDTEREAKKLLVDQLGGTLVTIAKDVKIQVEFNPAQVGAYRLIGYENRLLAAQDFNDDKKDAGEIGAGHTVTALYELTPVGDNGGASGIDPLKYQRPVLHDKDNVGAASNELMTVKLRYKQPDGDTSKLIEQPVENPNHERALPKPDHDFQFAAAVAELGMLLRESPYKGDATWKTASDLAEDGLGTDPQGYRHEFLKLIQRAQQISEAP